MFVKFFRFVFVGMKMRVGIRFSDFFWSLRCHAGDNVLVGMLVRVLDANRIVDQEPGGKTHQNQTEPKAAVGLSGE